MKCGTPLRSYSYRFCHKMRYRYWLLPYSVGLSYMTTTIWKFSTPPGHSYPLRGKSIVEASMTPKFRTIFLDSTLSRMVQKMIKIRYFSHVSSKLSFAKLKRGSKKHKKVKMLSILNKIVCSAKDTWSFFVGKHNLSRLTRHGYAPNLPKTHA